MKLRELLRKIDLVLRPPHVQGAHPRTIDDVQADGIASKVGRGVSPTGFVSSEQDERPHDR